MTTKTTLMQAGADSRRDDSPAMSDTLAVVLGALYDLNRHRDPDTLAQKIVSVVLRAIACDSAIFARIEPARLSFTFSSWPADRFAAVDHKEAARLHLQDHPLVAHFRVRRNAKAWSLHDLVSRDTFHHTMLYRTLYRPLDGRGGALR